MQVTKLNRKTATAFFDMFDYRQYSDEELSKMAHCSIREIMTWRLEFELFRPKEGKESLRANIIFFEKDNK